MIRLDSSGLAEVLKSDDIAEAVEGAAQSIAAQARDARPDDPFTVGTHTTDRRAASVTLTHPKGLAVQAKHGTLTKAAAAAGYEVRSK